MVRPKPKAGQPKLPIVDLSEAIEYASLFVYGDPKVGKTVLAATASVANGASPVLFCAVDPGVNSLRNAPKSLVNPAKVKVTRISRFEQFNHVYDLLYKNPNAFNTLVIDSITELHTIAMMGQMQEVVAKDPTREEFVPSRREYGIVRAQIRNLISELRGLPIHLIITAMLRRETDAMGVEYRSPELAGKLRTEIPGYCDVVALLEVASRRVKPGKPERKVQRILHLNEVSKTVVGTRAWDFPHELVDPTFADVLKIVLQ